MARSRVFPISPPTPEPPASRGALLTAEDVANHPELFNRKVKAQWVRRNVQPKVRLGQSTVLFYEADVRAWIEAHRQDGSQEGAA